MILHLIFKFHSFTNKSKKKSSRNREKRAQSTNQHFNRKKLCQMKMTQSKTAESRFCTSDIFNFLMWIWDQIFRQFVYIRLKTNLWNVNECGWISKMNLFGDRPIMVIEIQSHRIVTVAMHFGQPFNSMSADGCKPERKPSNDDPTIFSFEFSISQRYSVEYLNRLHSTYETKIS